MDRRSFITTSAGATAATPLGRTRFVLVRLNLPIRLTGIGVELPLQLARNDSNPAYQNAVATAIPSCKSHAKNSNKG